MASCGVRSVPRKLARLPTCGVGAACKWRLACSRPTTKVTKQITRSADVQMCYLCIGCERAGLTCWTQQVPRASCGVSTRTHCF